MSSNELALTSAIARLGGAPHESKSQKSVKSPSAQKVARFRIGLAPHASVLKTHVLKNPNRFVIDLLGQDASPSLPGVAGQVERIRFGKHPDFARIVIETRAPIERGALAKDRGDLRVTLDFAG
jgi:hypothetical protein